MKDIVRLCVDGRPQGARRPKAARGRPSHHISTGPSIAKIPSVSRPVHVGQRHGPDAWPSGQARAVGSRVREAGEAGCRRPAARLQIRTRAQASGLVQGRRRRPREDPGELRPAGRRSVASRPLRRPAWRQGLALMRPVPTGRRFRRLLHAETRTPPPCRAAPAATSAAAAAEDARSSESEPTSDVPNPRRSRRASTAPGTGRSGDSGAAAVPRDGGASAPHRAQRRAAPGSLTSCSASPKDEEKPADAAARSDRRALATTEDGQPAPTGRSARSRTPRTLADGQHNP
jgi:hypothetical protein